MDRGTTFSDFRAQQLNAKQGLPFTDVLSSTKIAATIADHGIEYRDRVFTPDVTLWTFLSQAIGEDKSCQAAVTKLIAFKASQGEEPPSANTAAYVKARTRLPETLISQLARECAFELEEQIPAHWLWRERHVKLVDGTTLSMPDTQVNQAEFPQPNSQKSGVGFPIARTVAVISCATGAVLDLAVGPYSGKGTGEHALLRELMPNFFPGDVALGDRYYCSFFLLATLIAWGVDAVFPMHAARDCDFRTGKKLGEKDQVSTWLKPPRPSWMDKDTYAAFASEILVRETEIVLENKEYSTEPRVLASTFLDPKLTPKQDLVSLYDHRWLVELDLRAIKSSMQMDVLRGKTPDMVRKEIWAHLLAYNLIRKVMAQAAEAHDKNPRKMSFKLAQQSIESFRSGNILCESKKKPTRSF